MPYSIGKLFRNIVGKSGRKIRNALTDSIVSGIQNPQGAGLYTGMGLYSGQGRYSRKKGRPIRRYKSRRPYTSRKRRWGNSLIARSGGKANATVTSVANETGDVIITHKEYLGDVYGPTEAFNVLSFQLNPGIESSFPWLSQIAANYEEYQFNQLVFSYRSTVTDIGNSTTGQCGTAIMATNYNPDEKPFYDKGQMLEYSHAMSCKTTESMDHGVECDPRKKNLTRLFVRSGPPSGTSENLKDYDTGKFQLAIANSPSAYANQSLGELWVYYSVLLSKPKLYTGRGNAVSRFQLVSQCNSTASANWPTCPMMLRSPYALLNQKNNLRMLVTTNNTNLVTITWPANAGGAYRIRYIMTPRGSNVSGASMFPPPFRTPDDPAAGAGSGNIKVIKDLISADGQPTWTWYSTEVGTSKYTRNIDFNLGIHVIKL